MMLQVLQALVIGILCAREDSAAQRPEASADPEAGQVALAGWRAPFDGPIATDRPDFTESTSTIPRGRFQVEGGYTFSAHRRRDRRTTDHALPELLLRSGLFEDVELRIGWEGVSLTEEAFRIRNDAGRRRNVQQHDDGGTDMNVGFKVSLLESDGLRPALSVIGALSLPTGAASKTSGDVDPEAKLLWGYPLSERLGLSGNFNFAVPSDETGRFLQCAASISLSFSISDWLGTYVEYFGFYPNERGADGAHYLNGGLTFPITEDLQFDVRAGCGLNEAADDLFTGVGFAFRF
ncbi:MAG TPA: transporter [Phycisphaerae bacterium]|jgi:hypothetical protein